MGEALAVPGLADPPVGGTLAAPVAGPVVAPEGGVVCFPRFRAEVRERAGQADYERFYRVLLDKHGTFVGPGHWFEMPDSYLRIGYAWPEAESLRAGLAGIEAAAEEVWGD